MTNSKPRDRASRKSVASQAISIGADAPEVSRRWRTARRLGLSVIALIGALLITTTAGTSTAFADVGQSGETNSWYAENAGGTNVQSSTCASEARDQYGNHATVWTDGYAQIHVSYNNGADYVWTNSITTVTPQVIWTDYGWRVFHTGTDGQIYYAGFEVGPDNHLDLGQWNAIPGIGDGTNAYEAPSVVAMHGRGEEWLLTWTGRNGVVYTQYHQRTSAMAFPGYFDVAEPIPGSYTTSSPSVSIAWPGGSLQFYVVWNNGGDLLYSTQSYGNPGWTQSQPVGGYRALRFIGSPSIQFEGNGYDGQIVAMASVSGGSSAPFYMMLSHVTAGVGYLGAYPFTYESTYWQTNSAPMLTVAGNVLYLLATTAVFYPNQPQLYWKQSGTY